MAQQIINVGAAPNDGTGDPIRTAYIKCNENFSEIYGRSAITTNNNGSFDMSLSDNFVCNATDIITISWSNITAGQSGSVVLTNAGNFNVSVDANTMCSSAFLSTVSATGVYLLNYFSDGTKVYLTTSESLS